MKGFLSVHSKGRIAARHVMTRPTHANREAVVSRLSTSRTIDTKGMSKARYMEATKTPYITDNVTSDMKALGPLHLKPRSHTDEQNKCIVTVNRLSKVVYLIEIKHKG